MGPPAKSASAFASCLLLLGLLLVLVSAISLFGDAVRPEEKKRRDIKQAALFVRRPNLRCSGGSLGTHQRRELGGHFLARVRKGLSLLVQRQRPGRHVGRKSGDEDAELAELARRIENGGLEDMVNSGEVRKVETKEQNTTQVLEEAHAECVMELMAERKASDVYNQGGNMPYQSGKTEQGYNWEQYEESFAFYIPLNENTEGNDLEIVIRRFELVVYDNKNDALLAKGTFRYAVLPEKSDWVVEITKDRKELVINLAKDTDRGKGENKPPKFWMDLFEQEHRSSLG